MNRSLLKGAGAQMTVQAFAIVVRFVKLDFVWSWWRAEIIDVNVPQSVQLRFKGAEHRIVGVTGVAGFLRRDAMVLKVSGSQIRGIIHMQALSVRLHDVARQTELSALGPLHLVRSAHSKTKNGQKEERQERRDLPATRVGDSLAYHEHANQ